MQNDDLHYRSRSPLLSPYFPNGNSVSRAVDSVMDLGFKLTNDLDPPSTRRIDQCVLQDSQNSWSYRAIN